MATSREGTKLELKLGYVSIWPLLTWGGAIIALSLQLNKIKE
jgi:hypothetical protein